MRQTVTISLGFGFLPALRFLQDILCEVLGHFDPDLGGVLHDLLQEFKLRTHPPVRLELGVEPLGLALVGLAVERLVDQFLVAFLHQSRSFLLFPFSFAAFSRQNVSTLGARCSRSISRARYARTRTVSAGTAVIRATSS